MTRINSGLSFVVDGNEITVESVEHFIDLKTQVENIARGGGVGQLAITTSEGTRTVLVNHGTRIHYWEPSE